MRPPSPEPMMMTLDILLYSVCHFGVSLFVVLPQTRCLSQCGVSERLQLCGRDALVYLYADGPLVEMLLFLRQSLACAIQYERQDIEVQLLCQIESALMEACYGAIRRTCTLRIDCDAVTSFHKRLQLWH